jgi:hypothetical protein
MPSGASVAPGLSVQLGTVSPAWTVRTSAMLSTTVWISPPRSPWTWLGDGSSVTVPLPSSDSTEVAGCEPLGLLDLALPGEVLAAAVGQERAPPGPCTVMELAGPKPWPSGLVAIVAMPAAALASALTNRSK